MATIAVDVDDTLYSFTGLAREIMAETAVEREDERLKRAAYAPWDEWRTPVDLLTFEEWMEIIDFAHHPDRIVRQPPFPRAADTLWELIRSGHDLVYITNRNPELFEPTARWLYDSDFPYGNSRTRLICTTEAKAPYIAGCQYLIDDRPKTIFEFLSDYDWKNKYGSHNVEKQRKAFALIAPYNRGMTDIPNLYLAPNWATLRHYLIEKGVLNADRPSVAV